MEKYLIEKYGEVEGKEIYKKTQERVTKLVAESKLATSEKRKDTLQNTILPRVALYQVLQERGIKKDDAYEVVHDYLHTVVCVKSIKQYKRMEKIPGFFTLFKKIFAKITLNSDLWTSTLKENSKDSLAINITRCLWHDACVEAGCPEICALFCGCDDENYSELKKMKFERKGSLGRGNDVCDFKFVRAK